MATPKKKISKSRRNMRRFSTAYKLDPVTVILSSITGDPNRPHRVTLDKLDAYISDRKQRKERRKKQGAQESM